MCWSFASFRLCCGCSWCSCWDYFLLSLGPLGLCWCFYYVLCWCFSWAFVGASVEAFVDASILAFVAASLGLLFMLLLRCLWLCFHWDLSWCFYWGVCWCFYWGLCWCKELYIHWLMLLFGLSVDTSIGRRPFRAAGIICNHRTNVLTISTCRVSDFVRNCTKKLNYVYRNNLACLHFSCIILITCYLRLPTHTGGR